MRFRHPALIVLLALLTLFVQQGAALHGLSHDLTHGVPGVVSHVGQDQDQGDGLPAPACEKCLAYGALGAALPTPVLSLAPGCDLPLPPTAAPACLPLPAIARPYQARAPPLPV